MVQVDRQYNIVYNNSSVSAKPMSLFSPAGALGLLQRFGSQSQVQDRRRR